MDNYNSMFRVQKRGNSFIRHRVNKKKQAEVLKNKQHVVDQARACLAHEDFRRYREKYVKLRTLVIKSIKEHQNPDPIQYAFEIQGLVRDLNMLDKMLNDITRESMSD